jgi:hypothetical protein
MNILINGASVSYEPKNYTDYLRHYLDCKIVNISRKGAGCTYIHESTTEEILQRQYDLAIISWPAYLQRIDLRIAPEVIENKFSGKMYTSAGQIQDNIWAKKLNANDENTLSQKDWIFSWGYHAPKLRTPDVEELFDPYYKYTSFQQHLVQSYVRIISLQSILKAQGIPYRFMFMKPLVGQQRYPYLYNSIDQTNVITESTVPGLQNLIVQHHIDQKLGSIKDAEPSKVFARNLANHIKTTVDIVDLNNVQ